MKISPSPLRRIGLPLAVVFGLTFAASVFGQVVTGTSLSITGGGASTLSGTLAVTGAATLGNSLNVTGAIDSDNNQFTFGTQSTSYGAGFFYNNDALPGGSVDTFKFLLNRSPSASWLWLSGTTPVNVMRLDGNHQLTLFQSNGTTAGVTLTPASNQISLGTATLTATGTALTTGGALTTTGALTVGGNIVNSTGSLTGGSTGLTLNAGGTNQNVTLSSSGTGDLVFNAGGAERARIKSTGNVGIGTTSPGSPLTVASNAPNGLAVQGNSTNSIGLALSNTATGGHVWSIASSGGGIAAVGGLAFYDNTAAANRMVVDGSGNVGIGVTSPNASLDIWKPYNAGTDSLRFSFNDGSAYWMGIQPYVVGSGNVGYKFRTNNVATTIDAMAITGDGNVGIGTTMPKAKFSVGFNNDDDLNIYSPGGNQLAIQTSLDGQPIGTYGGNQQNQLSLQPVVGNVLLVAGGGNVGIGTTNPTTKLQLAADNAEISMGRATGDTMVYTRFGMTTSFDTYWTTNATYDGTVWNYVNTGGWSGTASRIDQNSGAIQMDTTSGGTNPITWKTRFYVANSGKVGIGTTTPATNLHVVDPASGGGQLSVGESYASSNPLPGYTISAWGDGNVYLDTKLMTGGTIIYRYGEGAQNGAANTWMTVKAGNVGVGTTNPTQKLSVAGTVRAYAVVVDTGWSDYVFDENYRLAPLSEVEQTIKAQKHLPGIPSAQDVAEHGVSVGDMESKLLAKVEELTLHLIAQEKEINSLRHEVAELKTASVNP